MNNQSNQNSYGSYGYDSTPAERLKSIYEMLRSDTTNVRAAIETILDKTDGQYLIVRDTDGRELIKVSFIGGLIVAAIALFITRLRWIPFMPLILVAIYMRLSFQIDRSNRDNLAARAIEHIENE